MSDIKVGDRVRLKNDSPAMRREVYAVRGERAWVESVYNAGGWVTLLSALEKCPEPEWEVGKKYCMNYAGAKVYDCVKVWTNGAAVLGRNWNQADDALAVKQSDRPNWKEFDNG
jgi:hypothetical protein